MVLVDYARCGSFDPHGHADRRMADVEALSQGYQLGVGIQNGAFDEKYGYVALRARILRKALAENRLCDARSLGAVAYSVLS